MTCFSIFLRNSIQWATTVTVILFLGSPAIAAEDDAYPQSDMEWRETVNGGTVRIITKGLGCTCTAIASDMARVMNELGVLRVLPIIGHGSLQGIADVIYLRGIDLSILQSDVLAYVKRNNIHRNIDDRVRYVTKLYNSELHLIAGPGVDTIKDLHGRIVSYDVKGRGSFITAQNVFDSLGIVPLKVNLERDVAIEKIRAGEIAAAFVVTGKPADSMLDVRPGQGLHFVPVPFVSSLADTYLPSSLSHDDYPNLIAEGESVETIAVGEVLAVYNWEPDHERYKKLERFVHTLFDNIEMFHEPIRHRKWKDVVLTADLPGWQRFQPAQEWLDAKALGIARPVSNLRSQFESFLAESGYPSDIDAAAKEELFKAFLEWFKARQ